ncbi:hypothetical protein QJS10_CPB19g00225 [Acorus calamus]|uniref:Uncharacterized protein n=1 Tax=Acorus calamus TaxID=4465 RepID=A0AAV9CHC1_ACOCL|nr:hypothetical protein QJS10_CPB19g00225 [Acorus calamus]
MEKIRAEIKRLTDSKEIFAKEIEKLLLWKSLISLQMDKLMKDNSNLSMACGGSAGVTRGLRKV